MTTDNTPPTTLESESTAFGLRLQSARTALGLDIKDLAAQLRLNETVIQQLEQDYRALTLPTTFIRGYLRAYGKLLHIPEDELTQALEPLNPKIAAPITPPSLPIKRQLTPKHYLTLAIATLTVFIGTWWHTQTAPAPIIAAQNSLSIPAEPSASVSLGAKLAVNTIAPTKPVPPKEDTSDEADEAETTSNDNAD